MLSQTANSQKDINANQYVGFNEQNIAYLWPPYGHFHAAVIPNVVALPFIFTKDCKAM